MKDHPYCTGSADDRFAVIREDARTLVNLIRESGIEINSSQKLSMVINHIELWFDMANENAVNKQEVK